MKIKIGDMIKISHPSAKEAHYWRGFVTKKVKIKEAPWVEFEVAVYSPDGYFGKDYIAGDLPSGFANCWGMEAIKKLNWGKR